MTDLQEFLQSAAFAARKLCLQKRKDGDASPYINHPIEVAAILAGDGGVTDVLTLVAAVLHDTLEDTETTPAELAREFGSAIRDLVQEVTDAPRFPKAARKAVQAAGAPHLSPRAKRQSSRVSRRPAGPRNRSPGTAETGPSGVRRPPRRRAECS